MKSADCPLPIRDGGFILVLVLIALVAMMISGIALIRSMDTGQVMAGNLASRNSTIHSADTGVQQAVNWLQAQATSGALNADAPTSGYYAEAVEEPWTSAAFWATCTTCNSTDAASNNVSWVIHRICNVAGSPNNAGSYCASLSATAAANNGSLSSDAPIYNGVSAYYYRITVQVRDSRNTTSLIQAFVTM